MSVKVVEIKERQEKPRESRKIKIVIAQAEKRRQDGLIFTENALKELANNHPLVFNYDEETKKLCMSF